MASKKRDFRAGVPAVISFRWAFRLDLFRFEEALVKLFLKLLAHWSWLCRVVILGYVVRSNHVHLIVVQDFDGTHKREGISALMRNVLSQLGKAANVTFSHQGRIIERTYRSHNLPTYGDLLRQYAYVNCQETHHGGDSLACSRQTLVDVETEDGLVCQIPIFPELCGADGSEADRARSLDEIFVRMSARAAELERAAEQDADPVAENLDPLVRARASQPWYTALLETGEAFGLDLHADVRDVPFLSILKARDAERWFDERTKMRNWRFPQFEFAPRRAPRVGDIIEVKVRKIVETVGADGKVRARVVDAGPPPA